VLSLECARRNRRQGEFGRAIALREVEPTTAKSNRGKQTNMANAKPVKKNKLGGKKLEKKTTLTRITNLNRSAIAKF
jgi:hypothetical protein